MQKVERKIIKYLIVSFAAIMLAYFGIILLILCCWHSETSLALLANLYEIPASIFDKEGDQKRVIKIEMEKTGYSWELIKLISDKNNKKKFSANKEIEYDDLVFARFNKKNTKAFGFFFNGHSCSSYIIRGCQYKNSWYFDQIYRTIYGSCGSRRESAISKLHFTLRDINYFESRFSSKYNPKFWDDNWRIFKELKYESKNPYFEKKRVDLLKKYGNTCDFIVDFFKKKNN